MCHKPKLLGDMPKFVIVTAGQIILTFFKEKCNFFLLFSVLQQYYIFYMKKNKQTVEKYLMLQYDVFLLRL